MLFDSALVFVKSNKRPNPNYSKLIVRLLLFFLAIFFLLFLVIVGTDFVSYEYEDNGEAEDAEDKDGEENHVALLPTLRQRCILCCHIGQVFNNRPARMKIMIFPVLIFVFTKAFYKVMQNIKSTWHWIWTINDDQHIYDTQRWCTENKIHQHSQTVYWKFVLPIGLVPRNLSVSLLLLWNSLGNVFHFFIFFTRSDIMWVLSHLSLILIGSRYRRELSYFASVSFL